MVCGERLLISFALVFCIAPAAFSAQLRPAFFDEPARIVMPQNQQPGRSYPVFVVLPPTLGTAELFAPRIGLDPAIQESFILVLPAGRPRSEDYLPDFRAFVRWYEARLLLDLERVFSEYPADRARVYVGGYSLGGDLSWALSARNPELISGAVISGTRTSYPITPDSLERMQQRGFRAAFVIGSQEAAVRYEGINRTHARVRAAGVETLYREYPGSHSRRPTPAMYTEYISFISGESTAGLAPRPSAPPPGSQRNGGGLRPGPGGTQPVPGETLEYLLRHETRDRIALKWRFPYQAGEGGIQGSKDRELQLRLEGLWSRHWLRSVTRYDSFQAADDDRLHVVSQEIGFAYGAGRTLWGGGLRGDLWREFQDAGPAVRRWELIGFLGERYVPVVSERFRGDGRLDSLLTARYILPIPLLPLRASHVLNLELEYLFRLGRRAVFDASIGSFTRQREPASWGNEYVKSLDHVLGWSLGVGLRGPSPFLWRVEHRAEGVRAVGSSGSFNYDPRWLLSVEYSF